MPQPATNAAMDASHDRAEAARLSQIKALALIALLAMAGLFVFARLIQHQAPVFSYVAAFAEAAMIGGLADWYAVVALFRRPLGLPIPHTAIIPENQGPIAEKLGQFIESNFLARAVVEPRLREVDFAREIARWLDNAERAGALARFALRLAPEAIDAANRSGARNYLARRMQLAAQSLDITPILAGAADTFTAGDQHQKLLDEVLGAFSQILDEPETLAAIRNKIREELPTLLNLYRADAFLLKRIVGATHTFFDEVRADPRHPFRGEFDRFVRGYVERLKTSDIYRERVERLKRELFARPELAEIAGKVWSALRGFLEQAARGENPVLEAHMRNFLMATGKQLADDPNMRREINDGMTSLISTFVDAQKPQISRFIAEQVKSWNIDQLVRLIEVNVGRDLQFIRFNGMIVGGLAGVALHAIEQALRL